MSNCGERLEIPIHVFTYYRSAQNVFGSNGSTLLKTRWSKISLVQWTSVTRGK